MDWWDAVGCTQSAAEDGIGRGIAGDDILFMCSFCYPIGINFLVFACWKLSYSNKIQSHVQHFIL